MANLKQTSLIIKKESLYEKIRKSLITLIYQKDAIMRRTTKTTKAKFKRKNNHTQRNRERNHKI